MTQQQPTGSVHRQGNSLHFVLNQAVVQTLPLLGVSLTLSQLAQSAPQLNTQLSCLNLKPAASPTPVTSTCFNQGHIQDISETTSARL